MSAAAIQTNNDPKSVLCSMQQSLGLKARIDNLPFQPKCLEFIIAELRL